MKKTARDETALKVKSLDHSGHDHAKSSWDAKWFAIRKVVSLILKDEGMAIIALNFGLMIANECEIPELKDRAITTFEVADNHNRNEASPAVSKLLADYYAEMLTSKKGKKQ